MKFHTSKWLSVLALSLFVFFNEESLAIQCYMCIGDESTRYCNDPFDPNRSGVTKCTGNSCSKGKGEYKGNQFVIRNCSDIVIYSSACIDDTIGGMTTRVCACGDKDFCNNSRKFSGFTELFLFLSIASLALLLKQ